MRSTEAAAFLLSDNHEERAPIRTSAATCSPGALSDERTRPYQLPLAPAPEVEPPAPAEEPLPAKPPDDGPSEDDSVFQPDRSAFSSSTMIGVGRFSSSR